ncbi:MAG: hypothetical protein HC814_01260 [Rhodobacteraceae bacterium]|nr:hypothetical protein [Paracoccaceae bacterium]
MREDLELGDAALILEGIFGTGLARDVRDPYRRAILAVNALGESGIPIVSIDVPSGLDANSGAVLGVAIKATLTATMAAPKVGFGKEQGPAHVGEVVVIDLGAPPALLERVRAPHPPPTRD